MIGMMRVLYGSNHFTCDVWIEVVVVWYLKQVRSNLLETSMVY